MLGVVFAMVCTPSLRGSSFDQSLAVCLDDRVHIGSRAEQAFRQELSLLSGSMARLMDGSCSESKSIRISIRTHAPAQYETALGLAHTAGGRVLPAIELFAINILRTFGRQVGSERFGRALAKVAFHELQHYIRQEQHHDAGGLFAPSLSGTQLLTAVHQRNTTPD
ncbi:MAG: hypothetical protein WD696_16165 [Bryobacteraceae bacterium]